MSKIFKGTSILTAGDFVSRLFDVFKIIFITHLFSVSEFGIFSLVISTALIFAGFVMPNYGAVTLQFFPYYIRKGRKAASGFYSFSLFLLLLNGLLLSGIYFFSASWISDFFYQKPEIAQTLYYATAIIVLTPLANNLYQFLLSEEKFRHIFFLKILSPLTNLSLVLLFTYMGFGLKGLVLAYIFGEIAKIIVAILAFRRYLTLSFVFFNRKILNFWGPLVAASFFKSLTSHFPTMIIGRFLDTFSIGIYNIALKTTSLVFSITDPYVETTKAMVIKLSHSSYKTFLDTLNKHNSYLTFITIFLGVLGAIFAPILFYILYDPEYYVGISYFMILVLYMVLAVVNSFFPRTIYSVTNKNNYYFWGLVLSTAFQLPVMFTLTLYYSLWGLVISLALSQAFSLLLNTILSKKAETQFQAKPMLISLFIYLFLFGLGTIASLLGIHTSLAAITGLILFVLLINFLQIPSITKTISEVLTLIPKKNNV